MNRRKKCKRLAQRHERNPNLSNVIYLHYSSVVCIVSPLFTPKYNRKRNHKLNGIPKYLCRIFRQHIQEVLFVNSEIHSNALGRRNLPVPSLLPEASEILRRHYMETDILVTGGLNTETGLPKLILRKEPFNCIL
jgi:hypothetical protein